MTLVDYLNITLKLWDLEARSTKITDEGYGKYGFLEGRLLRLNLKNRVNVWPKYWVMRKKNAMVMNFILPDRKINTITIKEMRLRVPNMIRRAGRINTELQR